VHVTVVGGGALIDVGAAQAAAGKARPARAGAGHAVGVRVAHAAKDTAVGVGCGGGGGARGSEAAGLGEAPAGTDLDPATGRPLEEMGASLASGPCARLTRARPAVDAAVPSCAGHDDVKHQRRACVPGGVRRDADHGGRAQGKEGGAFRGHVYVVDAGGARDRRASEVVDGDDGRPVTRGTPGLAVQSKNIQRGGPDDVDRRRQGVCGRGKMPRARRKRRHVPS
jgi:hypothetical protein